MDDARPDEVESGLERAAWIAFAAIAVAIYGRLYYAVDFTDEAFYVALPWSFTLGHRPLVDEIAIHQLAGLLLTPLAALHRVLAGGPDGIVLVFRHAWFLAALSCGVLTARTLARRGAGAAGIMLGAFVLAYVPFAIPQLSYNSIAELGLLAGLLVLFGDVESTRPRARLFAGTGLLGLATFAYPTLGLGTLPAVLVAFVFWTRARPDLPLVDRLGPIALAGGLWAVASLVLLATCGGLASLERLLALNEAIDAQGGGLEKILGLGRQLRILLRMLVAMALVLGAALALLAARLPDTRPVRVARLVGMLGVGPVLAWISTWGTLLSDPKTRTPFAISILGLASVPLAVAVLIRSRDRRLGGLAWGVLLSLLVAFSVLWSTANGLRNLALGLLPAALLGVALLVAGDPARRRPAAALAFSLVVWMTHQTWIHVYHEAPIEALEHTVESGAWAGLRTSPQRSRYIRQLEGDLHAASKGATSVLFFDYFPAGYLLSELRPNTPALWIFPAHPRHQANPRVRPIYDRHFQGDRPLPDVVFHIEKVPLSWLMTIQPVARDPIEARFLGEGSGYRVVVTREQYTVLRRVRSRTVGGMR